MARANAGTPAREAHYARTGDRLHWLRRRPAAQAVEDVTELLESSILVQGRPDRAAEVELPGLRDNREGTPAVERDRPGPCSACARGVSKYADELPLYRQTKLRAAEHRSRLVHRWWIGWARSPRLNTDSKARFARCLPIVCYTTPCHHYPGKPSSPPRAIQSRDILHFRQSVNSGFGSTLVTQRPPIEAHRGGI